MTPSFSELKKNRVAWYKKGSGKPLLILHGWGSNSAVMLPVAEQVKSIRTAYLIDLPGFGHSPEPNQAWSIDDYADAVEEFADTVFEGQPFDLLAHSFGARISLKLLTRDSISDRIEKVVFTGAAGLKPKLRASYYLRLYTAKLLKLPFFLLPSKLRESGLNRLRNTAAWKKLGSSDYRQLTGVMRETFVKTVTEYLDDLLPEIEHEILLVWGKNDSSTPLDQAKRFEKGLKKNALVLIDEAGHYAFLDKPTHFGAIIKAYYEPKNV